MLAAVAWGHKLQAGDSSPECPSVVLVDTRDTTRIKLHGVQLWGHVRKTDGAVPSNGDTFLKKRGAGISVVIKRGKAFWRLWPICCPITP